MPRAVLYLFRTPTGAVGFSLVAAWAAVALLAPVLMPFDPLAQHAGAALKEPGAPFYLGTDEFGRDILSRVISGARVTFAVGTLAVATGGLVGLVTGLFAGHYGGALDTTLMRFWDAVLAFPAVLIGIGVAALAGPGDLSIALAVAVVNAPIFSRLTRASVLAERERDYVTAARAQGAGDWRVLFAHVLPNIVGPLLVQASAAMGYAVLLQAGLSFLGIGTQLPHSSWGSMLNFARGYLRQAPWYALVPGLALSTFILGLNLLTDTLRDALDPRELLRRT